MRRLIPFTALAVSLTLAATVHASDKKEPTKKPEPAAQAAHGAPAAGHGGDDHAPANAAPAPANTSKIKIIKKLGPKAPTAAAHGSTEHGEAAATDKSADHAKADEKAAAHAPSPAHAADDHGETAKSSATRRARRATKGGTGHESTDAHGEASSASTLREARLAKRASKPAVAVTAHAAEGHGASDTSAAAHADDHAPVASPRPPAIKRTPKPTVQRASTRPKSSGGPASHASVTPTWRQLDWGSHWVALEWAGAHWVSLAWDADADGAAMAESRTAPSTHGPAQQ